MNKTVSIIMTVFNCECYLSECIESILNQTYDDFEFIIADDGSTDNSREIIKQYQKMDTRIKLIEKANTGVADSLNTCINASTGTYIARMDADDIAFPERLQKQVDCMKSENIDVCYTYVEIFGDVTHERKIIYEGRYNFDHVSYETLLGKNYLLAHPTVMFKRDFIFDIGFYNTSMYCEDWDLWIRALKRSAIFKVIPEKLLGFRKHEKSTTASRKLVFREQVRSRKLDVLLEDFQTNPEYPMWNKPRSINCAIWGAGSMGKNFYECLLQKQCNLNVEFFIDTYKSGKFLNKDIVHPTEIKDHNIDFIFVTLLLEGKNETIEVLEKMGMVAIKDYIYI